MLLFIILIPLIMIVVGIIWLSKPPKNINCIYGYRTQMSMQNQNTWNFAHRMISRLWLVSGIVLMILSIISYFLFKNKKDAIMIITLLQVGIMMVTIIPVEISLHRHFEQKGKLK